MNAERLLAYYERVADAPDAIPRLRQFILDLAVRGKLVPQDPNDEPAPVFDSSSDFNFEPAFDIPREWKWAQLSTLGHLKGGGTPSKGRDDFWNGKIPWVSPKDMKKDHVADARMHISEAALAGSAASVIDVGSILFVVRGMILAHSFPVALTLVPVAINQDMKALGLTRPEMAEFLLLALKALKPEMLKRVKRSSHGTCRIEGSDYSNFLIPIPSLPEQRRIVAKVDELMALCDQLKAARAGREATRDRLTAVSLARLNAPDANPAVFAGQARFALDSLSSFTTRADQVKQLRQTILNLAVYGKLVAQDPKDEPASKLVERIAAEKRRLLTQGLIPRHKAIAQDHDAHRDRPQQWKSSFVGELSNLVTSGSRGWAEFYSRVGSKFVRAQNIRFGSLKFEDIACVSPPKTSEGRRTQVAKDDLLVVITGAGVTNPVLLDRDIGEAYVSQHVGLIKLTEGAIAPWLLLWLMAPAGGRSVLVERAYGAGRPGLNLENIRSLAVDLPPLAEQRRIVAKVDELMALCDRLEASLVSGEDRRSRLLNALLAEALAPAETAVV